MVIKSLNDRVATKLKDDAFLIDGYLDELLIISSEKCPKKFIQCEMNHLARLIKNQTKDLLYYYYTYIKLSTKDKCNTMSEWNNIIRHGCPEIGKRETEKTLIKMGKSLKIVYSEMNESDLKKGHPGYIEFYLERHDKNTAYKKYKEYLENRSRVSKVAIVKSNLVMKNNPSLRATHIDYYMKKYDGDEVLAKAAYKERQGVGSLKNFIKRHGAKEGYKKWTSRQRKWQHTMNSKPLDEQARINRLKVSGALTNNVSNESNKFFNKLSNDIDYKLDYGSKGEEFCICYNGKNHFYYDGFIKELGIVIEYHGSAFHPRPLLYDWVCVLNGADYKKIRLNDLRKKKVAIDNGYKFLVFWDTDQYDYVIKTIKEVIDERIA